MTPEDRYELGVRLGESLVVMFDVLALLDGIDRQAAIEGWISAYITERIEQERE